jgi:hypothetical protein
MDRLAPGMQVFDVSDRRVGEVIGTRAQYGFCVKREAEQDDIWLPQSAIFNVERNRVTLVCNRAQLSRYKIDPPSD